MHVARQIVPHVASVNASTEQRGEQRFQAHVDRLVERHASLCESIITYTGSKNVRSCYAVVFVFVVGIVRFWLK